MRHVQKKFKLSERRACRVLERPRSSQRYFGKKAGKDMALPQRMRTLSYETGTIAAHMKESGYDRLEQRGYIQDAILGMVVPPSPSASAEERRRAQHQRMKILTTMNMTLDAMVREAIVAKLGGQFVSFHIPLPGFEGPLSVLRVSAWQVPDGCLAVLRRWIASRHASGGAILPRLERFAKQVVQRMVRSLWLRGRGSVLMNAAVIVLELLFDRSPKLRRFSSSLTKSLDAWIDRTPGHNSLLYSQWISGSPDHSGASEILGSLGIKSSTTVRNTDEWARKEAYSAVLRALLLYERGQGVPASELEHRWAIKGLGGIEERTS